MTQIPDHPLRYQLANELHARPYPLITAPCNAVYLAIKKPVGAANRDREIDRAHLLTLLDRYGAQHPRPEATHYFGDLGRFKLKWELHTEFVTYTVFSDGKSERPFDPADFEVFPADWLADAPGVRITSALIRIQDMPDSLDDVEQCLKDGFVAESIAVSYTLDKSAIIAGDFRIDQAGHLRFSVFIEKGTGERRIGRTIQRLTEVETYKTMSMIGLPKARELSKRLAQIDTHVSELVNNMSGAVHNHDTERNELLDISSELEALTASTSFRFGATKAYAAIVNQRVRALREERFGGRQTFSEFMMRRYDPAMLTISSVQERLETLATRVMRAADLLRTRVEVERSEQNQNLLKSMDNRADAQLRLQKTVEGLSVVAISYYAINLVSYAGYPIAKAMGVGKPMLSAIATPFVILGVWWVVRRIRKSH